MYDDTEESKKDNAVMTRGGCENHDRFDGKLIEKCGWDGCLIYGAKCLIKTKFKT